MTAEDFASRLKAKRSGDRSWQACCPAHEDKSPSLSITKGAGKILLKCFAGCEVQQIVAAMGLEMVDLWEDSKPAKQPRRDPVATYDYNDENGNLLFQSLRYEPKRFSQRHPDGKGGWTHDLNGVRRILYQLPKVLDAVKSGRPVIVTEGEKDADAVTKLGFCATCNPGGVGMGWRMEYCEPLAGADVVIISDKDEAGRKHAQKVASMLHGAAASVRVLELPDCNGRTVKDAFDWISAGGDAAELDELAQAAPEWTPTAVMPSRNGSASEYIPTEDEQPEPEDEQPEPEDELPAIEDAAGLVANLPEAPMELVEGILHQGSKLVLGGSSKSNKTWTLVDLAISVSTGSPWFRHSVRRGRVLFINLEIQRPFFARRLEAVAAAKHSPIEPGWLDTWNLRGHCATYQTLLPKIGQRIKEVGYVLVIIDPIYKLSPGDENAAKDIGALMLAIERLATSSGAAIAIAAHFSKGNQAGKESIDRISGSGVFARDPDTILTLTAHQEENAFTVETILRNHKPIAPFVVRWLYPLMRRDDDLDPKALKQAKGRPPIYSEKDALDNLPKGGMAIGKWQKWVSDKTGMSRSKFFEVVAKLRETNQIKEDESGLVQKVQ